MNMPPPSPDSEPPRQPEASREPMTESQTIGGQAAARRLSLGATMPPAEVPGVRLQRFLGSGAFGQVWVGRDINTGRGVAVKFYLHRGGVNWSLLSREVKNLVQLSADRHVVQVLEVGWDADPPYYVMELIEGGSLEDMLVKRGRLPVAEAVDLFRKILIGLNHCHGKGVLHCDIKPANILLAADNEPRLADFGQSRMSHDQTPAMGTLFYMAPEQADFQSSPDARWDVYAAGAILFRMLAGSAPHRDQALLSQLDTAGSLPGRLARYREAIALAPPASEQLSRRDIDRSLRKIMQRCLEVDPESRYSNVQQILDDLTVRDKTRSRRPLMLLGIVGPLLLLLATCFFGARSIDLATRTATRELRTEAFGSNQFAARLAAQTLETEIQRYFDLVHEEAQRETFETLLADLIQGETSKPVLDRIASSSTPVDALVREDALAARDILLEHPAQLRLDEYLSERLAQYRQPSEPGKPRQRLATMFVTDGAGTIMTIVYGKSVPRAQNSVGRNFAYRTYFTGRKDDYPSTIPMDSVSPLRHTHLSSAFQSTATKMWKVAISTPLWLEESGVIVSGRRETPDRDPDAVFVATINLGDFQLLQRSRSGNESDAANPSQVAVLVEAREGDLRGTVLQHPLMDQLREEGQTVSDKSYQVDGATMDRLLEGGDVGYRDPMALASEGNGFGGEWIAAMEPVTLPRPTKAAGAAEVADDHGEDVVSGGQLPLSSVEQTDLLVLVQYRLSEVLGPVAELRRSLLFEGAFAIVSILVMTLFLWWVVRRVTTQDERRAAKESQAPPPPQERIETMTLG
ncbi:MAG TPA: serine/threonine protein kinase [Rhodopirellula baltica]|uniref:Serine/threonine protein kinase-related protein n=2 Tax=Rhodopirellula baltica TaxID=265606 RepID=L7CIR2_RHOBT|nr:serine/threonine-protein kinase [Rhodopirellula baltica]ELP33735.1 Serine/threonine protein kinase-related protein [Rhodopirellula baltica SWK14]CAD72282.1 probable serine/threonine-protein kinase [Rhodopirellula baltica SH 1]HBE66184.1 serine/threonine protein kinase [Rhodopirellula baltica]